MAQQESGNGMNIPKYVMICHNCESDDIKFNAEQERYVCEECGCTQMNLPEPVNTASIGDNKRWIDSGPVSRFIGNHRGGFGQTLCADCKAPTPLNDMFPTGPDNIFKCWSCANQIPVLADITD